MTDTTVPTTEARAPVAEDRPPARHVQQADRLRAEETPLRLGPIDLAPVLGLWQNSNPRTRSVARFTVTARDGRLWLRAWAVDPDVGETYDWGEVPVETVYTDGPRSVRGCGFTATFDHGHARTRAQTNQSHGVTVLVTFTTFHDGSGRQNYFSREFYQREG